MKKTIIAIAVILILGFGFWYLSSLGDFSPQENGEDNDVVAIVNGEEISRSDLNDFEMQTAAEMGLDASSLGEEEKKQVQSQAIEGLISRTLLYQEARNSGIEAPEDQIDEQIEDTKSQFESDEEFEDALENEGITEEELRSRIGFNVILQSYIDRELDFSSVKIEESEVEDLYNQVVSEQGEEAVPPLEEVYEQVESMLTQQKQEEVLEEFIENLKEEADIEILI
jgi:hypothetical protein